LKEEPRTTRTPTWLVYQRCVAAFAQQQYGGMNVTVLANVFLTGAVSGVQRQVDVLIDSRWGEDNSKRIIVDAKNRKSKIDINDVETIIGMMEDCRANHAVIVCTAGYTKGAIRRAQDAINIVILTLDQALEYKWCYEPCLGECTDKEIKKLNGAVLWGEFLLHATVTNMWMTLQTGKCDMCHNFHVWCWDCGQKFAIPDEVVVVCDCGCAWASIPESPASGHIGEPTSIWLLMRENEDQEHPASFDRKPI
jgi:hypothetical protein